MKKIIKKNYLLLIAMAVVSLASCTDKYSYDPAQPLDNAKITLEAEQTSYYFEGAQEQQEFSFNVNRPSETGSVTISLVCDNDKVKVPETVTFNDGETTKTVTATSAIAKGEKVTVSISTIDTDANIYSEAQYIVITLERDKYAWITCGKAIFVDNTFGEAKMAEVEVQRCEGEGVENTYKLVNPYLAVYEEGIGDIKFKLDDTGKPVDMVTENNVIVSLFGYDFYFDPVSYGAYCYFEKDEDGIYWVGCLLKQGSSLYTGGSFGFMWTEGYPY